MEVVIKLRLTILTAIAFISILAGQAKAKAFDRVKSLHAHQARINFAREMLLVDWRQIGKHHAIAVPNAFYYRRIWRISHNAIQRLIPHKRQWLCIHRFEGSWQDSGSPYYGGLQMDLGFQRSYGSYLLRLKGTANNWTPLEQMAVAENAYYAGRGFYPWPNTARYCGLI